MLKQDRFQILNQAIVLVTALLFCFVAGCVSSDSGVKDRPDEDEMVVITTISPITSIVENIGGTRIHLEGIIPEGINSHTYEPAPSVAKVFEEADLIILNGMYLEEPSLDMAISSKKSDAVILALADKAISKNELVYDFSFPEHRGYPNPHLWTNPLLALEYSEIVLKELVALDPINSGYYQKNQSEFELKIIDLHERIHEAILTIPLEHRKLLTYHDSFPFFAEEYGMEIIGVVQPSDFSEPSAREVVDLIEAIRESGVPAIFGSEVFPSDIMEQIAKEGGAKFVDQLRDDDLPGKPGDDVHTYLGMMLNNVQLIVEALGGSSKAMVDFDPSLVFTGDSGAIYPQ